MKFILMSLLLFLSQNQQTVIGEQEQIKVLPLNNQSQGLLDLRDKITLTAPKVEGDAKTQSLLPTTLQPNQLLLKPNLKTQQPHPISTPPQIIIKQQIPNKRPQPSQNFYCGGVDQAPPVPPYDGVKRQKLVSTIYGFNMYIDTWDTMVSNVISNSGTWQPNFISLIGHIVKPGYKVLNLGSQSGLEALVMGKIVGPTGKLFIFEPYSFSNQIVTKNVKINKLSDITTIYKYGASDKKGTAIINIAYTNTGGSEIIPDTEKKQDRPQYGEFGRYSETQQVQLDRVDALLPEDVALDFALIDVEKMQTKALLGMKGVIDRSPNLVIMTQWQYARNPRANKDETIELLTYLFDKGYQAYAYNPTWIFCTVGYFSSYASPEELLRVDFQDIFFFPKTVQLPK